MKGIWIIISLISLSCESVVVNSPSNKKGDIYGIDISHHQGKIDWQKVRSWKNNSLQFVYIKATEGSTFQDDTYKYNFNGAQENDFLTGSYHYFRTSSSVKTQFMNFKSVADKDKQGLAPLIDVEEMTNWNQEEFHENFQDFLNMIEQHYGKKPLIYTVNSFYNKHLSGKYTDYHFLIGRYGKNAPNMKDNSNWSIWQFTESGFVEGIEKPVDIDVVNSIYSIENFR